MKLHFHVVLVLLGQNHRPALELQASSSLQSARADELSLLQVYPGPAVSIKRKFVEDEGLLLLIRFSFSDLPYLLRRDDQVIELLYFSPRFRVKRHTLNH